MAWWCCTKNKYNVSQSGQRDGRVAGGWCRRSRCIRFGEIITGLESSSLTAMQQQQQPAITLLFMAIGYMKRRCQHILPPSLWLQLSNRQRPGFNLDSGFEMKWTIWNKDDVKSVFQLHPTHKQRHYTSSSVNDVCYVQY